MKTISASTGRNDFIPPLVERGLYCNHLVCPSVCPSIHTFVKDVSTATGRNDFIFDTWLWHSDLYRVSPFQVYRTSTRCFRLVCDPFSGNEYWDIYKFDTNERVGVFLARRSVQHLVFIGLSFECLMLFQQDFNYIIKVSFIGGENKIIQGKSPTVLTRCFCWKSPWLVIFHSIVIVYHC